MISRSPLKNTGLNLSTPSFVRRTGSAARSGSVGTLTRHSSIAHDRESLEQPTNPKRQRGRALPNTSFPNNRRKSARPRWRFGLVSLEQSIDDSSFRQHAQFGASLSVDAG